MSFVLRNAMESLVLDRIDSMYNLLDCCHCEKCRMDIAACALNMLPPKYVATLEGELFCKLGSLTSQHEADVATAITKAASKVKANPHH